MKHLMPKYSAAKDIYNEKHFLKKLIHQMDYKHIM
jgi:hypothetical protein